MLHNYDEYIIYNFINIIIIANIKESIFRAILAIRTLNLMGRNKVH